MQVSCDELHRALNKAIDDLGLDLSGRTVLTEAANGAYVVTPLLAAMAGARVFAYGKSTKYGSVDEIFGEIRELCTSWDLSNIQLMTELTDDTLNQVDIVTNSGHLRPLNADKLKSLKSDAVIALMYEAWEYREADLDLDFCRQAGIRVGATNERHPAVGVFDFLGEMALEQIRRAGLELAEPKVVLICNNEFGPYIARTLIERGFQVGVIDSSENQKDYPSGIDWLGNFPSVEHSKNYKDVRCIIFTAYPFDLTWIGHTGAIQADELAVRFPEATLLRFAGDICEEDVRQSGISFFPEHVEAGHMGILPSDVGVEPVIRLQAGGLRVGQALLEENMTVGSDLIGEVLS